MGFLDFLSSKKTILGVDIGTANIKIAQVTHEKTRMVLDTFGIVNVPFRLSGKEDPASVAGIAEVLRLLLARSGTTTARCVMSFPSSQVFSSVVSLPQMNEKETASAVEFEAKKYVPLPLEEIDLSWSPLGKNTANSNSMQVLLTAVPKQLKKNYLEVFRQSGLRPEVGDVEAPALIRSLVGQDKINCVIIDIGAKATGVNIVENGLLRLSRNLTVGGETVTSKISESLKISTARAEQFKKDFGINGPEFMPDAVKPVLNIIKSEVKQILNIYLAQRLRIDKLILAGGGANMPGLLEFFSDMQIPVEMGDPLKFLSYPESAKVVLKRSRLSLPVAIGLALRKD